LVFVTFCALSFAEDRANCGDVIAAIAPVFAHDSYLTGSSGKIQIEAEVSSGGDVTGTRLLESSGPNLRKDSENAARQWKFSPASNSRKCTITFYYRIMPDQTPEEELTSVFHYPLEFEVRSKAKPPILETFPAATHR
jgi:hypothetical protein